MKREKRLQDISQKLIRGDLNRIAARANVSRDWVSRVLTLIGLHNGRECRKRRRNIFIFM